MARDKHGNVIPQELLLARVQLLEHPPLHDVIAALSQEHHGMPRWPNGHRFAACLTHDVDYITSLHWRERWRRMICCAHTASPLQVARWAITTTAHALGQATGRVDMSTYDYWLEEEERHRFHSTFFVLPEQLFFPSPHDQYYRYSDPVCFHGERLTFAEATQRVQRAGWEVGLHGSYASAYDERVLRAEKDHLEQMVQASVRSIRQHYLRFDAAVTPHLQAAAGFQADTTLGFNNTIGCRAGMSFPYFWPGEDGLLEVPLIIQDVGLLRAKSGQPDLGTALLRARALLAHVAHIGGVITLSWHTHSDSPGAHVSYRMLLDTIEELGGWGCSVHELDAWWRERRDAMRHTTQAGHDAKQTHCTRQVSR